MKETPALLMLEDGACFEGFALGTKRESVGEVVFATAMSGYQETLTDPSYHGQIVCFTAAHIGNYGCTDQDDQSAGNGAGGAVIHDVSAAFSNWRAEESLDQKLARMGLAGICGVDTRSLTLHLREHGSLNGIISAVDLDRDSLLSRARELPSMAGLDLTGKVTCGSPYVRPARGGGRPLRVAVLDFGVKNAILDHLTAAGMDCHVLPAATSAEDILGIEPDGVFLSNGPGDPAACGYLTRTVGKLLGRVPVFGICLGHQILASALGATTYKLKFGHHGVNQPVKDLDTGRILITSQNHGFCVDPDSLPPECRITHVNCNDGTVEGLAADQAGAFSVQFHPEAAPGPNDALNLFARFRTLMEERNASA